MSNGHLKIHDQLHRQLNFLFPSASTNIAFSFQHVTTLFIQSIRLKTTEFYPFFLLLKKLFVAHADLGLTIQLRMNLNFQSCSSYFPSVQIAAMCHGVRPVCFWRANPGLHACQASTLPAGLCTQSLQNHFNPPLCSCPICNHEHTLQVSPINCAWNLVSYYSLGPLFKLLKLFS